MNQSKNKFKLEGLKAISEPTIGEQPTHPVPTDPNPTTEKDLQNITNFLRTQEAVPTAKPRNFIEQVVLVWSGGSARAYFYDTVNLAWRYTALT